MSIKKLLQKQDLEEDLLQVKSTPRRKQHQQEKIIEQLIRDGDLEPVEDKVVCRKIVEDGFGKSIEYQVQSALHQILYKGNYYKISLELEKIFYNYFKHKLDTFCSTIIISCMQYVERKLSKAPTLEEKLQVLTKVADQLIEDRKGLSINPVIQTIYTAVQGKYFEVTDAIIEMDARSKYFEVIEENIWQVLRTLKEDYKSKKITIDNAVGPVAKVIALTSDATHKEYTYRSSWAKALLCVEAKSDYIFAGIELMKQCKYVDRQIELVRPKPADPQKLEHIFEDAKDFEHCLSALYNEETLFTEGRKWKGTSKTKGAFVAWFEVCLLRERIKSGSNNLTRIQKAKLISEYFKVDLGKDGRQFNSKDQDTSTVKKYKNKFLVSIGKK